MTPLSESARLGLGRAGQTGPGVGSGEGPGNGVWRLGGRGDRGVSGVREHTRPARQYPISGRKNRRCCLYPKGLAAGWPAGGVQPRRAPATPLLFRNFCEKKNLLANSCKNENFHNFSKPCKTRNCETLRSLRNKLKLRKKYFAKPCESYIC